MPFPLVVVGAGLMGLMGAKVRPDLFLVAGAGPDGSGGERPAPGRTVDVGGSPSGGCPSWPSWPGWARITSWWFISQAAVVTFRGAYALLAYIAQEAVAYGWLGPKEMLDGRGLAETTPAP